MSDITAKVVVQHHVKFEEGTASEQVQVHFVPDYNDGRNQEWSRYTPAMNFQMTVLPEVAERMPVGKAFTLVFQENNE